MVTKRIGISKKETDEFKKLENSLKKKLVLEDELKLIEDDYSAKIS